MVLDGVCWTDCSLLVKIYVHAERATTHNCEPTNSFPDELLPSLTDGQGEEQ